MLDKPRQGKSRHGPHVWSPSKRESSGVDIPCRGNWVLHSLQLEDYTGQSDLEKPQCEPKTTLSTNSDGPRRSCRCSQQKDSSRKGLEGVRPARSLTDIREEEIHLLHTHTPCSSPKPDPNSSAAQPLRRMSRLQGLYGFHGTMGSPHSAHSPTNRAKRLAEIFRDGRLSVYILESDPLPKRFKPERPRKGKAGEILDRHQGGTNPSSTYTHNPALHP